VGEGGAKEARLFVADSGAIFVPDEDGDDWKHVESTGRSPVVDDLQTRNIGVSANQSSDLSVDSGSETRMAIDDVSEPYFDSFDELDDAARDDALAFVEDFLDCDCDSNPYCGHPERKFVSYLLELRADGFGPEAIVDAMGADYGLAAYPGDVLSFLDDSIRTLDAAESLAEVDGAVETVERIRAARDELT
jgi:superfamily II helicase